MHTFGFSESAVWHHAFFETAPTTHPLRDRVERAIAPTALVQLDALRHFVDPFDKCTDTTAHFAIYAAKLDWLMFDRRRFELVHSFVGPPELSDHCAVFVELQLK